MNHLCPTCFQELPLHMELSVNLDENVAFWKHHVFRVTPREAEVLYVLIDNSPRFIDAERLILRVWGVADGSVDSLRVIVSKLRRKLREADVPVVIDSHYRSGYALKYGC